jgi:thiol-disulfide isomerase/thioredoxin
MIHYATTKTFNTLLLAQPRSLLVFMAVKWCPHCVELKPVLEEIAKEHPQSTIIVVDEQKCDKVMDAYGIEQYPTLMKVTVANGKITKSTNVQATPAAIRRALKEQTT